MYGTYKTQISNNQAQSPQEVPGFTLAKTSPRLMLTTASETTTSNSFPIFCNNARGGGEDGTNDFSTKKLSAKELKDNCTVYNRSYPNKMKLHPSRLSGLKLFAWENMVELKDGELFFNWPWLGKKLNIALAKDTHEPIPKELVSVFDHLLNIHEIMMTELLEAYKKDFDSITNAFDAVKSNLVRDIMLGNFILPETVPPLTLLISDPEFTVVPMPIVSNKSESPMMKLVPIQQEDTFLDYQAREFSSPSTNVEISKSTPRNILRSSNKKSPDGDNDDRKYYIKLIKPKRNVTAKMVRPKTSTTTKKVNVSPKTCEQKKKKDSEHEVFEYTDVDDTSYEYNLEDDDDDDDDESQLDNESEEEELDEKRPNKRQQRMNTTGPKERASIKVHNDSLNLMTKNKYLNNDLWNFI